MSGPDKSRNGPGPSGDARTPGVANSSGGSKSRGGGDWLTVLAIATVLFVGACVVLVLPLGFFGPVIVFGGIFFTGVVGFHYFVWGRWMTRIVEQERLDDDSSR